MQPQVACHWATLYIAQQRLAEGKSQPTTELQEQPDVIIETMWEGKQTSTGSQSKLN